MRHPILPPATIGILGSGQLGRMLAIAARTMSYCVHVLSPEPEPTPTGMLADKVFTVPYGDLDAVRCFARGVDVVTYEFENVPAATVTACAELVALHPGVRALSVAQNRLREKAFFTSQGLPVVPYAAVQDVAGLRAALAETGAPAILKTATSGYDGKGQVYLDAAPGAGLDRAAEAAWDAIQHQPAILEGFVEFERELSVVAARGQNGSFAHYGLVENEHANHILDVSTAPAGVPPRVVEEAVEMAHTVMAGLDIAGVLCVEFFLTGDGRLLLNEIAPRPHNSGHLTIEACITSQFEQQLRAVCGLPLGDPGYRQPAAMANLLGDLWFPAGTAGELQPPDWTAVLGNPQVKLHLYGKQEARPGRKMGHLTALARTPEAARALVVEARRKLARDA
jgi:5-(carboxyamino)imidazole ribonucleotide synthase